MRGARPPYPSKTPSLSLLGKNPFEQEGCHQVLCLVEALVKAFIYANCKWRFTDT